MFTFQRPTATSGCSSQSSTSLSSPMNCRLLERFTSAMKDLEEGLRETLGFPGRKEEKIRHQWPALSYCSRPGHLRGILRTPWSRRLEICCRSGRRPPPLQHTATQVPQKRAQLSPCTVFCPELSETVSSQVTWRFLWWEKTKAPGTD